ncbi:hypothetical protein L873DRAFT_1849426 [Choiromyces venosus 120613-1]|uniref:Uncharacterized protein n=1 Tax=Choiromyces venosus 120613-1 TaxID=1336337 RepID=A0A3N4ITD7_9PEZI|nr:hypothetical protein L873DRAFT_1849426 [Choiromyces venosus 120613-1]
MPFAIRLQGPGVNRQDGRLYERQTPCPAILTHPARDAQDYQPARRKIDEDQSSGNTSHITWERFSDHHTQYTNRFSAIEKDVSTLGSMSETLVRLGGKVNKLEGKVNKLEGKIHTEFKTLGAKIEKHDGMMVVAWCMLLVPFAMVCGKIGYDWYEDHNGKTKK